MSCETVLAWLGVWLFCGQLGRWVCIDSDDQVWNLIIPDIFEQFSIANILHLDFWRLGFFIWP
jgi:hypothetical protein